MILFFIILKLETIIKSTTCIVVEYVPGEVNISIYNGKKYFNELVSIYLNFHVLELICMKQLAD